MDRLDSLSHTSCANIFRRLKRVKRQTTEVCFFGRS